MKSSETFLKGQIPSNLYSTKLFKFRLYKMRFISLIEFTMNINNHSMK